MRSLQAQKSIKMVFAFIAGSILLIACGSQSSSQQGQKPAQSSMFTALSAVNTPILLSAQTPQTLLNVVRSSGKAVGVFEFVGVTCESCKTESPAVAAQLAPYANSVTRVVIFPNAANQYTTAEYQNFINSYSQGARYAVDSDLVLLKSIRADKSQYFGLFIIVKSDGTAVVLNQSDAVNRVLPAVKAALGQ